MFIFERIEPKSMIDIGKICYMFIIYEAFYVIQMRVYRAITKYNREVTS